MPAQPSHFQITEISKETIPFINWMLEDIFCRYGVSIPYFMMDFEFPNYGYKPDWVMYDVPDWNVQWPAWPHFTGWNFNLQLDPWEQWFFWFNELIGILFDTAGLPRWQLTDFSEDSVEGLNNAMDMLNTRLSEAYDNAVIAKHYCWTERDGGGILQLWTGLDSPALGFTATKRTSGSDYEDINDPGICVHGGKIYMAYAHEEYFVGTQELWTAAMDEDGTNFSETKRRTFPSAKAWESQHTQIHASGTKLYLTWIEWVASNYKQVFTGQMDIDGSNWSATQRTSDATNKTDLDMQIYNDMMYVLYVDSSGGNWRLNIAFMDLDGNNWEILQRYSFTGAASYARAKMHIVDDTIYLFWRETSTDYHYDYLYLATRNAGYERLTITSKSAAFTVGETITGADSGATATIEADAETYLDISGRSETAFTDNEEIEGGTSTSTATMVSSNLGGWSKSTLDTIDHWVYHDPVNITWTHYHTMYVARNLVHLAWMQSQGTYPSIVNAIWTGLCNTDKTGFTSNRREYDATKSYNFLEMKVSSDTIYYITLYYGAGTSVGPVCTATMNTGGSNWTLTARTNTTGVRADVNMAL